VVENRDTKKPGPGRPRSPIRKKRVTFSLPERLLDVLADMAHFRRMPQSELLARIMIEYFEANGFRNAQRAKTFMSSRRRRASSCS